LPLLRKWFFLDGMIWDIALGLAALKVECPETYAGKFGTPVVVYRRICLRRSWIKVGIFSIQLIAASIMQYLVNHISCPTYFLKFCSTNDSVAIIFQCPGGYSALHHCQ
jgi:hypothetical protein